MAVTIELTSSGSLPHFIVALIYRNDTYNGIYRFK